MEFSVNAGWLKRKLEAFGDDGRAAAGGGLQSYRERTPNDMRMIQRDAACASSATVRTHDVVVPAEPLGAPVVVRVTRADAAACAGPIEVGRLALRRLRAAGVPALGVDRPCGALRGRLSERADVSTGDVVYKWIP